jgi:iron complex outermembrane recepter protein
MNRKGIALRRVSATVAGVLAVSAAPTAFAQAPEVNALDEVVVTARKRAENLQDVPLSISAITAAEIEKQGISSVQDVAKLDASVIFDKGFSATDTRIAIRGLSPGRGRVNVAVLVDGIDTSSESISFGGGSLLATNKLLDLQTIEVVKGPQSALFGRSAFAGAINYVTKDPSDVFEGGLRGEIGDYGQYELIGSASGPVNETFGWRANAVYWNKDGIYRNFVSGQKVGYGDGFGIGLTGKWEPSEAFDAKLHVEYTDDTYGPFAQAVARGNTRLTRSVDGTQCLTTGTTGPGTPIVPPPASQTACRVYAPTTVVGGNIVAGGVLAYRGTFDDAAAYRVQLDTDPRTGADYPGTERQIARASLVMNWNIGPGTLTSLTGFTDAEFDFMEDGDFDSGRVTAQNVLGTDTVLRATEFNYNNKTQQISQELRYRTDFEGPFNFMLGGLYWNEDAEQIARSVSILCFPSFPTGALFPGSPPIGPACQTRNGQQVLGLMTAIPRNDGREIEHISAFGMAEFEFADIWKLTAEIRTSEEDETILGDNCSPTLDVVSMGVTTRCQDPTFPFAGFGPSINILYPFFNPLAPPGTPGPGVRQLPGVPAVIESSSSSTTPRVTLQVKPTEDLMVYATYARGIKPGGVSTVTGGGWQDADYDGLYDEFTYKAEKLTEYEVGAKSTWLDGRLRLNGSIFALRYSDKQAGAQLVTPSGILVGRIINAGKVDVNGFELDGQWAATDKLSFGLNYSYLDGEYKDFPLTSTSATDASRFGSCPRGPNPRFCYINLKGNQLERAPEHSLVATARWATPVPDMMGSSDVRFFIEGDMQAQGERFLDQWNRVKLDDYVIGNLRIGLTSEKWDLAVFVNNVADDDTILSAINNPGIIDNYFFDPGSFSPSDSAAVSLPDPRIIGLRFNFRFGGK